MANATKMKTVGISHGPEENRCQIEPVKWSRTRYIVGSFEIAHDINAVFIMIEAAELRVNTVE